MKKIEDMESLFFLVDSCANFQDHVASKSLTSLGKNLTIYNFLKQYLNINL